MKSKINTAFPRIGLVANTDKAGARTVVRQAAQLIARSGRGLVAEQETARMAKLKVATVADTAALARETDLVIVFGGDGTMLRIAREIGGIPTPILGVNVGALGFLTIVPSGQLALALKQVWSGDFRLESRPLIEAHTSVKGEKLSAVAFNDFVISRGLVSRLIELDVAVDGSTLTRYRCDGLIVCTPTGSTAYSLAAGGAIVAPAAEVFTITPICPHTLSNRSVIVSLNSRVQVRFASKRLESILSADGQTVSELATGDTITIQRSPREVLLLQPHDNSFFDTLRIKLKWSGSSVGPTTRPLAVW